MTFTEEHLIKIRRDLHKIPEVGFAEFKTQAYLLAVISKLPQEKLTITPWETGLIVTVKGSQPQQAIAWRTDIDGLPITEATGLSYASQHENHMHACGHDFHMTIALGILSNVIKLDLKENYVFIFQPAEENLAGGKELYDSGILAESQLTEIYALHVQPNLPVGTVSTKEGTILAGDCEFQLTFHGKGGHGAYPHESNDMIVAASQLIQQLQTIVSRNVDPMVGAVVTVATIHAGEATNVIPETLTLSGSIRTLSQEMNQLTQQRLLEISAGIELSFQCEIDVLLDQKGYVPVVNHQKPTQAFSTFVKEQTDLAFVEAQGLMTAEDFGYYLTKIPGMLFWLGVESPYELHHNKFQPAESAIAIGVKTVTAFFEAQEKSQPT
ncbi:N-acetyldiaminopimelate deacetylase [Vagococcus salmoninarum]|uniref:N-acetyldiaminopimelate deacetylase n=1 Tax=Vagococcus salmoninarum TaxID=2739 RepID=UPI001882B735|nr:N-acetyldiaminopimelate deacetylase [Vagococcus salmoninarum]MBE9390416.1 N-acetyldiaminopimelate deacetylase [Vagococcus salmoninarum]